MPGIAPCTLARVTFIVDIQVKKPPRNSRFCTSKTAGRGVTVSHMQFTNGFSHQLMTVEIKL
jgi:hypothetical protein